MIDLQIKIRECVSTLFFLETKPKLKYMSAIRHFVIKQTPFTVEFTNGTAKTIEVFQVALTNQEIIAQYDYVVFPAVKPTGLHVENRAKQFKVTLQVYKQAESIFIVGTFAEALDIQRGASAMVQLMGWTRHSSCDSEVSHLDSVFDLYNEGFITVQSLR